MWERAARWFTSFDVLERELVATEEDRAGASGEEARPGEVVFSSADEGSGIREDSAAAEWDARFRGKAGQGVGGSGAGAAGLAHGVRARAAGGDDKPVRSPSDPRMQPPGARPALGEVPERIPDAKPPRESPEEILARLGIDTRRRGR
jgi:hypothetical protein